VKTLVDYSTNKKTDILKRFLHFYLAVTWILCYICIYKQYDIVIVNAVTRWGSYVKTNHVSLDVTQHSNVKTVKLYIVWMALFFDQKNMHIKWSLKKLFSKISILKSIIEHKEIARIQNIQTYLVNYSDVKVYMFRYEISLFKIQL
jgi:hypothetical protein